ncbi:hypothetical protein LIER_34579 [Lithospermum erythrorhizon]|uniref:Helitron helicase-like domain-containing protein n=1 Tax=Lithospermum erythrorhizon TaxID=34254 RepID=A0AAV3S3X9_LITER
MARFSEEEPEEDKNREYGKLDIFLTMTCIPNWPEIKEHLHPGEEEHNRPDLLARVFKDKLSIMHDKLTSGEIFGQVGSMLLTPEAYDRIVCVELPDKTVDTYFYSFVVRHMMHGPCGNLNQSNVCMKDGRCKNHYPKEFSEYTTHGTGSYPIYHRKNDKRTTKVRGKILDNSWVIPYNPTLLLLFNCHINVEICCDIRALKYLYKYVHKGHDKVMFRIASDTPGTDIDEIASFQDARWVSPVEAAWRIFGFPLHGMFPAVLQLQVHMPKFQTVHFDDDADLEELLLDERQKRTMLTEFFRINQIDGEARRLNLLYKEFPKHYVWDSQLRTWTRRKRGVVIDRLCVVNPVEN